jgi:hypothetical protein
VAVRETRGFVYRFGKEQRRMGSKATGERRRRLRDASLIAVSLAMVLVTAAPGLTQESNPSTGASETPEAVPYQDDPQAITDEASGAGHSPTSEGASQGDTGTTPVPGDQNREIGGDPTFLNLAGADVAPQGQQPGPEHPPSGPTEDQHNAARKAARAAQQAAQEAQQTSDAAQEVATRAIRQAAVPEEAQAAQQAAQEARQASDATRVAAQAAQQAAARNDVQAAQEAAETAQRESGAAQAASQAAQQAIEWIVGTDVKDAYTRALQAARTTDAGGNNAASTAEGGPGGRGADPEEATGEEATDRDTVGGEGITGKDALGEAEPKEDVGEARSDTAEVGVPVKGGVPLSLGGGALLVAGVFAALKKALRPWFRPLSVPETELLRPSGSGFEGESEGKDGAGGGSYRRRTEKASRFTA